MSVASSRFQYLYSLLPVALGIYGWVGLSFFPQWLACDAWSNVASASTAGLMLCGAGIGVIHYPGRVSQGLQFAIGVALLAVAIILIQTAADPIANAVSVFPFLKITAGDNRLGDWPDHTHFGEGISFLLAGLAFMLLPMWRGRLVAVVVSCLGIAVTGIGLMSLFGTVLDSALFYNRGPFNMQVPVPVASGLTATGVGLFLQSSSTGWYHAFYNEREDRRIFVTGVLLFTLISLVAGLIGIGIVGRYAMVNFQEALWASFRSNNELFQNSVITAVARSRDIVYLSELQMLVDRRAPPAYLKRELDRIVQIAKYEEIRSLKVVNAKRETLAQIGVETFSGQFNVQLPLPETARLFWNDGWRLMIEIPLGRHPNGGAALVEVAMSRFDQYYAQMQQESTSEETRVCFADGDWMRCFPSRLSPLPSSIPLSPKNHPLAMHRALKGEQGVTGQLDYRGHDVIAAYGMLSPMKLGLVQKIDTEEFYKPLRRQLRFALLGLALLIVSGAWVLYWRTRPLVSGLVRARARLDAIFNNVPAGVVTINDRGLIVSANQTAEGMFGYGAQEMGDVRLDQLLHDVEGRGSLPAAGRVELVARRKLGSEFQVEVILNDFKHDGLTMRIAIIQDITQRRTMENEIAKWGNVFKYAGWGMAIGSIDGKTVELVNPAFARMYGYTVEELTGRSVMDLLAPQARALLPQRIQAAEVNERITYESLHLRKEGGVFPVWLDITVVRDLHGNPKYRAVSVVDISERKRMEQVLSKREEEFRALVENSPDMIIRFDGHMRCLYINPAVEGATGLLPAKIKDRTLDEIPMAPGNRVLWSASIRDVIKTGRGCTFEFSFRDSSSKYHYQARLAPEFGQNGNVATVLAVVRDISLIKRSKDELRQSHEMLRKLSAHMENLREEERKRIAREVHDELGQSLTVLRMYVSLMRLNFGGNNPQLMESIQSMKEVVDRTIYIARNVTSALRPAALDFGLTAALEWLTEDFAKHSKVNCQLLIGEGEIVLKDNYATALFRIAQESLTNVIKHAGATEVKVSLLVKGSEIRLEVCDNGMGFSPEAPRKSKSFGLMGMRERALMLGGEVKIRSAVGKGTCVTVFFPHPSTEDESILDECDDKSGDC